MVACREMTRGGLPGLEHYWRLDVLEFGNQLKTIDHSLTDKYEALILAERAKVEISDNNVALLTGNFGEGLGDLGLDILGRCRQCLYWPKFGLVSAVPSMRQSLCESFRGAARVLASAARVLASAAGVLTSAGRVLTSAGRVLASAARVVASAE
jgi:hypothetical protein